MVDRVIHAHLLLMKRLRGLSIVWDLHTGASLVALGKFFPQVAKLLLKVTLGFGGRGLHALEMCLE